MYVFVFIRMKNNVCPCIRIYYVLCYGHSFRVFMISLSASFSQVLFLGKHESMGINNMISLWAIFPHIYSKLSVFFVDDICSLLINVHGNSLEYYLTLFNLSLIALLNKSAAICFWSFRKCQMYASNSGV